MTYLSLCLQIEQGLARVTLNQPEAGNSIDATFCAEWMLLANELAARDDVRAILLTARGRFFSVGGDIAMFANNLDALPQGIRDWTANLHGGIARMAQLNAPMVVAVQGGAIGGAVGLLAGFDVVYGATRGAFFGSGHAGIGFSCDGGTTTALTQRMGLARARRFVLLGETLRADEAKQSGLVDFVVDDAELQQQAETCAMRLANGPTRAYGEIRRLFAGGLQNDFEAQLENEAQALIRTAGSLDAREGIRAFAEKRKSVFRGK